MNTNGPVWLEDKIMKNNVVKRNIEFTIMQREKLTFITRFNYSGKKIIRIQSEICKINEGDDFNKCFHVSSKLKEVPKY